MLLYWHRGRKDACGMVITARWTGLNICKAADLVGFIENSRKEKKVRVNENSAD